MSHQVDAEKFECPAECPQCPSRDASRPEQRPAALTGWRLAAAAALAFGLPLAFALAGGILAKVIPAVAAGKAYQAGAVIAALILGIVVAAAIVRRMRVFKENR